jgi:uncharacterized protein
LSWYLDASVIVPLFVEEGASDAVQNLLQSANDDFIVSSFAKAEVASALSRRVRKKEISPEEADIWIGNLDEWLETDATQLAVENHDILRAGEIVRNYQTKLLTPDAIHLAVCQCMGLTLVTLDKRLSEAAEVLGVGVVVPY